MTQAPTPGPLSVGAGPYSCIRCDNSTWNDDDICDQCAAEACAPENAIDWPDAPTAPVEASGSEREGGDYTMALAEVQPFEDYPELSAHIERMATTGRIGSMIEWDGFLSQLNATILALLSARPLALGGQHSVSHGLSEEDVDQVLACSHPNDGGQRSGGEEAAWTWLNGYVECDPADTDYSADEMVDAFIAGQSTTPARAEAQDEGAAINWPELKAAGYRVEKTSTMGSWRAVWRAWGPSGQIGERHSKGEAMRACRTHANSAHPSPPPAADEDRVRIASGLTPDEQKAQASRCGCRGTDELCPCQNVPDRQTIMERRS